VNWADLLRAASAFAIVLVALTLGYALIRLASLLDRSREYLNAIDRETVSALERVNGLLDQAGGQMTKIDTLLTTAVDGTQAAERSVRRIAAAVETPLAKAAELAAFLRAAASSFGARRTDRRSGSAS
jgi:hypothetical protein